MDAKFVVDHWFEIGTLLAIITPILWKLFQAAQSLKVMQQNSTETVELLRDLTYNQREIYLEMKDANNALTTHMEVVQSKLDRVA